MDEHYDVIILGTGLKESLLAGLLASISGKKILHIDKHEYYGADTASLNLKQLCERHNVPLPQPFADMEDLKREREVRKFLVDVVPKFVLADGKLVKLVSRSRAKEYLSFKLVDGSYVAQGGKIQKVPATQKEVIDSKLMSLPEKFRMKSFLEFVTNYEADKPQTHVYKGKNINTITAKELFHQFGLADSTILFIGHAMALQFTDEYLDRPAVEMVCAVRVYTDSILRFGKSSYVYPAYGIGDLPQAFCRLAAVFNGVYMLRTPIEEILFNEDGHVTGVRTSEGVATCDMLIADPSYVLSLAPGKFGPFVSPAGRIVLGTYIMRHTIAGTSGGSAQIIIPYKEAGRRANDVYVTMQTSTLKTVPQGYALGFVSTTCETNSAEAEIQVGERLLGEYWMRFVEVKRLYEPEQRYRKLGVFVTRSYDASSMFNTTVDDVLDIYAAVTGEPYDLERDYTEFIPESMRHLVEPMPGAGGH